MNNSMPEDFAEFISHLTDNARTSLQHYRCDRAGLWKCVYGHRAFNLLGVLARGGSVGAKLLCEYWRDAIVQA